VGKFEESFAKKIIAKELGKVYCSAVGEEN